VSVEEGMSDKHIPISAIGSQKQQTILKSMLIPIPYLLGFVRAWLDNVGYFHHRKHCFPLSESTNILP
jgi:hypothetical protein